MDRPFTPVRTSPPARPAALPANTADICYNCHRPGHVSAHADDDNEDDNDVFEVQKDELKNL